MVADGITDKEILEAYPDLELADIQEALRFSPYTSLDSPPNIL